MDDNTLELHQGIPSEIAGVVVNEAVHSDDVEILYPEYVEWQETRDEVNVEGMELVPFDDTDEEERAENIDMGTRGEEDEDRPIIDYDRENPTMAEGNIFPSIIDCRNALATFCINNEYDYVIEKSDPDRLRVYCPDLRCRWRMHASNMRNSTVHMFMEHIRQLRVDGAPRQCWVG
jgi:hypothetical protein